MPLRHIISDGKGMDYHAKVTSRGELVTGPIDFSLFYTATTLVNDTAVNVVPPVTGKKFIITIMVLSGDRSIGANGAVTDIFEADSATSGTIVRQLYQDEIAKQTRAVLPVTYVQVGAGRWINVKSDDVQVRCNIAGYYVNV